MNILLVGSHPGAWLRLEATILRLGFAVSITKIRWTDVLRYEAKNGARFDVAFVDVNISETNGYESLAILRAEQPRAHLIVVDAFDGNVDIARARKMGASSFLSDSPRVGTLIDALRRPLEMRLRPVWATPVIGCSRI
jgi:DNA-binding NarL/FixJ family response regulator